MPIGMIFLVGKNTEHFLVHPVNFRMQKALNTLKRVEQCRYKLAWLVSWKIQDWGICVPYSVLETTDDFMQFEDVEAVSETVFEKEQGVHSLISFDGLEKILREKVFFFPYNTQLKFDVTGKIYSSNPHNAVQKGELTAVIQLADGKEVAMTAASAVYPEAADPTCFVHKARCPTDPVEATIPACPPTWQLESSTSVVASSTTSSEHEAKETKIILGHTSRAMLSRWADVALSTPLTSETAKKLHSFVPKIEVQDQKGNAERAVHLHHRAVVRCGGLEHNCTIEAHPSFVRIHHHGRPVRAMASQFILKAQDATVDPMTVPVGSPVLNTEGILIGMIVGRSEKVENLPGFWIATPIHQVLEQLGLSEYHYIPSHHDGEQFKITYLFI